MDAEKINHIVHSATNSEMIRINLAGMQIEFHDSIIVMWIIMAFMIISAWLLTKKLETVPGKAQNIAEIIVEQMRNLFEGMIGHQMKPFVAYLGTVWLFLVIANMVSIFNIIPNWEQLGDLIGNESMKHWPKLVLQPPTKDLSVTAALAVMSICLVLFSGLIVLKPKKWIMSFFQPTFVMFPFKVLDYFVRPMSLCFRLFGNILAACIMMEIIYSVAPLVIPGVASIYFDFFDGVLQASIFVLLTSIYLYEAIEENH